MTIDAIQTSDKAQRSNSDGSTQGVEQKIVVLKKDVSPKIQVEQGATAKKVASVADPRIASPEELKRKNLEKFIQEVKFERAPWVSKPRTNGR